MMPSDVTRPAVPLCVSFLIKFTSQILRKLTAADFPGSCTFSYTSTCGVMTHFKEVGTRDSLSDWRTLTPNLSLQRNGKPSSLRQKEENFWTTKLSWWRICSLESTAHLLGTLWKLTHLTSRGQHFIQYFYIWLSVCQMSDCAICPLCNAKKIVGIQNIYLYLSLSLSICACICACVCACMCACL